VRYVQTVSRWQKVGSADQADDGYFDERITRVLPRSGQDYAGTAPITITSGKRKTVLARNTTIIWATSVTGGPSAC
jgi:hypothetical protein